MGRCYHPYGCALTLSDGGRGSLLPDTHAHLDESVFAADLDQVLARAREAGVDRVLAVGSNLESSKKAIWIARQHHAVYAAVGVHPHEAHRFLEEARDLEALLDE